MTSWSHIPPVSNKARRLVLNLHNKLQIMLIKNKTFLRKRKSTAFWQKHCILAKSRHSQHLTKIMVSVFPWLSTVPP